MNERTFKLLTTALLAADRQTMGNAIALALGCMCDDLNINMGSFISTFGYEGGERDVMVVFATHPGARAKLEKFIADEAAGADAVGEAENEGVNALRRRGE